MNKDFWFMVESATNGIILPVTSFFAGDIDYFTNILNPITSPEEYLKICSLYDQYGLEGLMGVLFANDLNHNGHLEYTAPRYLFKSPWLGISSSITEALIPGLKEPFVIKVDIVKHDVKTDSKEVAFVIEGHPKNELIKVNLYRDGVPVVETELMTGAYIWWIFGCDETKVWKMEIFHNNKLVRSVERTTEDIFWNKWSFFRMKNLEN